MTFKEMVTHNIDQKYNQDQIAVWDLDERIPKERWDELPKSNSVIIKVIPSGGEITKEDRRETGNKISGISFLVMVVGVLTIPFGVGFFILGAGTVGLLVGQALRLDTDSKEEGLRRNNQTGLRGSRNRVSLGGRVNIVLGRHRLSPDFAANSYISTITNKDNVKINQLFVVGYKDVQVEEGSIQFKDTPIEKIMIPGTGAYTPVQMLSDLISSRSFSSTGKETLYLYSLLDCQITFSLACIGGSQGIGVTYKTGKVNPVDYVGAATSVVSVYDSKSTTPTTIIAGRTYKIEWSSGSTAAVATWVINLTGKPGNLARDSYVEQWLGGSWGTPIWQN